MSYCRKEGKDTIIFTTKEDHEKPSTVKISEPEPSPGLIFPDGSVNWNCPCLGGMATGPCGVEFREAFECFHYSTNEPKGSECFGKFQNMQECFTLYPNVYDRGDDRDELLLEDSDKSFDRKEINTSVNGNNSKSEIEDKAMNNKSESLVEKK